MRREMCAAEEEEERERETRTGDGQREVTERMRM